MDDTRGELLYQLMVAEFAAIDLNLFLDTHPRDEQALAEYARAQDAVMRLKREYEEKYGPLVNFGHASSLGRRMPRWQWLNEPWPWEETCWVKGE